LSLFDRVRRVTQLLGDPRTPKLPRAAVLLSVLYLLWPIDALPEWLFSFVGYLDDLVVMWFSVRWLLRSARGVPPEPHAEPPARG
jgi:uncharacterized membrane protein YkvA (DUF1232 family)